MPSPIHIAWRNRPGVGEYGVWRIHGSHQGFDTYTLPKATIYGTANGGVVIGKGYAEGGWGHWIDVRYPGYTQRDCHMNEATGLRVGAPVGTGTALGRVGQTGNAKGIAWWHAWFNAWLWHVHSEVYLSRVVDFKRRTNPLPIWGVTTAGENGIPIPPPPPPKEDEMEFGYFSRTTGTPNGKPQWALTHPLYFPDGVFITQDISLANGFAPYTDRSELLNEAGRWDGMIKTAKLVYDAAWAAETRKAAMVGTTPLTEAALQSIADKVADKVQIPTKGTIELS